MSNLLIVTAHPTSKNLTQVMAKIYQEAKEQAGDNVEVIDLYQDKPLEFLSFETHEDLSQKDETREYYQAKITQADEIVFIYPFWWGSMPAILKNWIDQVFMSGFAFKYDESGRPKGLLNGKRAKVISTSGAPTFWYCLNGIRRANKKIWKQTIIEFCGMKFEGYHLFGGVDTSGKNVDKILTSVKKLAN